MQKDTQQYLTGFLARNRHRRIWKRLVAALSCAVVFCTTYALILPAITMEKTQGCEIPEHTHSEACYTQAAATDSPVPVCSLERLGLHTHTDACLDENGTYCCGYADFVVHTHDDACLDPDGNLWCPLPVIAAHTHSADCYAAPDAASNTAELICSQTEVVPHIHEAACFDEAGNLICGMTQVLEHVHQSDCFQPIGAEALTCTIPEDGEGHIHGPLCYGTWELTCGMEAHTHTPACMTEPDSEPEPEEEPLPANTLAYTGPDYQIVLRYGESAGIPQNAELTVTEITGEAYQAYLEQAYEAVDSQGGHTLVQFSGPDEDPQTLAGETEVLSGRIAFARFFDLTILADGAEIEPADAVEVTIRYDAGVDIGEGDKTAIHFTQDGRVELLNADSTGSGVQPLAADSAEPQAEERGEDAGQTFVFLQSSFSVTGTITIGDNPVDYGTTTEPISWFCGNTTIKTLTVYAKFDDSGDGKSITIKVPTGFNIISYSATEDTPDMPNVTKVTIDNEYKDYVLSSTLSPASLDGGIVGVSHEGTWETQMLRGYAGSYTSTEVPYRTCGGDITYALSPETQTVEVVVTLRIYEELLSHTTSTEAMGNIEIITASGSRTDTTKIQVKATGIPIATFQRATGTNGLANYNADIESEIPGRSAQLPIAASVSNYLSSTAQNRSWFEKATFVLTYPEGVFYEPDTALCRLVGYWGSPIKDMTKNGTKTFSKHLAVTWMEGDTGGGSITFSLTNAIMTHSSSSAVFYAAFRANTDPEKGKAYGGGDKINLTFSMTEYERNGRHMAAPMNVPYARTLLSTGAVDGKDIRLMTRNYTRRDITADFGTDLYSFGLGGFAVYSALPYKNNTFYFENTDLQRITALNLVGKNTRDITIKTSTGRLLHLDTLKESDSTQYGIQYMGTLLELSAAAKKNGVELDQDEYITACLFTADFEQITYNADHPFGGFVYVGQFQDGDNDGRRDGEVVLRQLKDNTTYEEAAAAAESGDWSSVIMINGGSNAEYGEKPIQATGRTKIGWNRTGVGRTVTTVKNANTGLTEPDYYANTKLLFESQIHSGYAFMTQDMIIDPVLVISLPRGISLDTTSVQAKAPLVSATEWVPLVQDGLARETVVNEVTWRTYRFRVPDDKKLSLVAKERVLGAAFYEECKIYASFQAVVDPTCQQYDLSLQDVVMWDLRNDTGQEDRVIVPATQGNKTGTNGDAVNSHWSQTAARTDKNNFLGYGKYYGVANNGGMFVIKPLIGLDVDLAIKSVASLDEAMSRTGNYYTYNGLSTSILPVLPGKYADVRLIYRSTSDTDYFEGTAIYVPVPKKGVDYAKYFENVNLFDPMNNESDANTETFGFTTDLTGPVSLSSDLSGQTTWKTLYAELPITSNSHDHENTHEGQQDTWEPVEQSGGPVRWLTEDRVTDWSRIAMMKFVAQDNVSPGETGTALMRLAVHDVNAPDGPALGGTYDYWRGYSKAVTDTETLSGNWKYTSVVAATPAMETVKGQIFVDADKNGVFDGTERPYSRQQYTAELSRDGGGMEVRPLAVQADGSFALTDEEGREDYLPAGTYTVTVRRNGDPNFRFANTDYTEGGGSSVGQASPADRWYNNAASSNNLVAVWRFTVTNNSTEGTVVHRVGIAVKAATVIEPVGTKTMDGKDLSAGEFTFALAPEGDAPVNKTQAENDADGNFTFGKILYDTPGAYIYRITETIPSDPRGIVYDGHTATVTVTVTENADGTLSAEALYDNAGATTERDRAETAKAAFTNSTGFELPQTGGTGTALYTVGGLLLMAAAGVLLWYRKNKRRKEDFAS